MKRLLRMGMAVFGLVLLASSAEAQRVTTQAAQQPGGWCQKCVPPGACEDTGNGEWGYTICRGLGGNQCEAGGYTCKWSTGAMNVAASEQVLASGETSALVPLAPFVWIAADCEDGSLVAVGDPIRGLARADAGAGAWAVMALASR